MLTYVLWARMGYSGQVASSRSRNGHNQIGSMGTLARNQSTNSAARPIGTSMSCTTRSNGGRPLRFSILSAMLNRWSYPISFQ
jgi:hypothetical protein